MLTSLGAYYRLNDDLVDSSGNGRDLTASGTPTYAASQLSNGLATNGGTKAASWPTGTPVTQSFSVAGWFYATNGTSAILRAGAKIGWGTNGWLEYVADTTGTRGLRVRIGGKVVGPADASVTNGTWNHGVLTWDHSTTRWTVYVNGRRSATGTITPTATTFGDITVNATNQFSSGLDEVGLWSRALNLAEVAYLASGQDPTTYVEIIPPKTDATLDFDFQIDSILDFNYTKNILLEF